MTVAVQTNSCTKINVTLLFLVFHFDTPILFINYLQNKIGIALKSNYFCFKTGSSCFTWKKIVNHDFSQFILKQFLLSGLVRCPYVSKFQCLMKNITVLINLENKIIFPV